MGHNDFDQDIQQSDGSPWPDCPEGEAATTAMVRLRARLFAGRLDRESRRAIRLGEDESAVRSYLWRALKMAPELLVEKPKSTLAMLVACVSLKGFRQLQQMVPGAHA